MRADEILSEPACTTLIRGRNVFLLHMNKNFESGWSGRLLSGRWFAFLVAWALVSSGAAAESLRATNSTAAVAKITTKSPWQRIVMIGASATAGFTLNEPFGGPNTAQLKLSRYIEAALTVPHEPVRNFGSALLFLQPELLAGQQVTQALTNQPTLVIGVDFLFWFCYGAGRTDAERLGRFEQGLELLEKFEGPLVVGDLPDASATVNIMLRPEQMPSLTAIAAANQQLKTWAATRPQVAVVALSEFMSNAMANRAITIRDFVLPEGTTRRLVQDDKLHPTPAGAATLALAVLEAAQSKQKGISTAEFHRDPKEIFRRGYQPPKPAPSVESKTNGTSHK